MKKYLQAVYQSFGSPQLYAQVIYRWTGNGIMYLAILSLLVSLLLCARLAYSVHSFNQNGLPPIANQIPTITIANGEAKTDVAQPHYIKSDEKNLLVVIDTNVKADDKPPAEKGIIFIGRHYMLTQQNPQKYERFDFADFKDHTLVISKENVTSFFANLTGWSIICLPILAVGYLIILLVMSVLAGALSYIVTAYMPEEYNFETRMRMGAIAITPPLIISKLLEIFTQYHLGFWVILALWVIYLYAIVLATRHYLKNHSLDAV